MMILNTSSNNTGVRSGLNYKENCQQFGSAKHFAAESPPAGAGINIFEIEMDMIVGDITSERLMFLVVMVFKVRCYSKM